MWFDKLYALIYHIDCSLDKGELDIGTEWIGLLIVEPDEHLIRIRDNRSGVGLATETGRRRRIG